MPDIGLPENISIDPFLGETSSTGEYQLIVKNTSTKAITLPRGKSLGTIEMSCQIIGKITTADTTTDDPSKEPHIEDDIFITDVEEKYKKPLQQLLYQFRDLFSSSDTQLGSTGVIKHTIDTQGKGPIRLRTYRMARRQKEETDNQLQKMLDEGIVELSTSAWAAPVVLVEKKRRDSTLLCRLQKIK